MDATDRSEFTAPMLKILTFSTLFPNPVAPHHGIFTETTLRQQLRSYPMQVQVVAPVPWFPSRAPLFGRYAGYAGVPHEEVRAGVRVLHPRYLSLPRVGMHVAPLTLARAARPIVAGMLAAGHDFDLIDAHYFYPDGVAAVLLGRTFGKPVTITALGSDINLLARYRGPRRMMRWAAGRSAAMISVCQALRGEMVRLGMPGERIHALRNGVDLDLFYPEPRAMARAALGVDGFTLLSVGHLVENKGHDKVIRALAALPDTRLLVAGCGPERARLEALARQLGVAGRVRFGGVLRQDQLRTWYSAADALVLASSREGWANVLLEAMACGTPALASDVGGTAEVITCPAAGLLLPENSAAGIAGAVHALRAAPPARAATRAHAARHAWHDTARARFDLFARIAGRPPTPAEPCTLQTNCLT
jgi:glycosyltransferase involved in cell wall biosynthesis